MQSQGLSARTELSWATASTQGHHCWQKSWNLNQHHTNPLILLLLTLTSSWLTKSCLPACPRLHTSHLQVYRHKNKRFWLADGWFLSSVPLRKGHTLLVPSWRKNPTLLFALKSSGPEQGTCAHPVKGGKAGKLREVKQTYEHSQPLCKTLCLGAAPIRLNPL